MKGFRGTAIVSVLIIGFASYVYFFEFKKSDEQAAKKEQDAVIFAGVKPDAIEAVEFENAATNANGASTQGFKLLKEKGVWRFTAPIEDLADSTVVNEWLAGVLQEKTLDIAAEGDAINLKTFGLDPAAATIRLKYSDGKSHTLQTGTAKAFDGGLYAQLDHEKKIRVLSSSWSQYLGKSANDLRLKNLDRGSFAAADQAKLTALTISKADGSSVHLVKVDKEWKFAATSPIGVDQESVVTLLNHVKNLKAVEFASETASSADLAKFKLARPAIEVKLAGENVWTVRLSAPSAQKSTASGKTESSKAGFIYARASGLDRVGVVPASAFDNFNKASEDFYDKAAPFRFDADKITEVHIAMASTKSEPALKLQAVKTNDVWKNKVDSKEVVESSRIADVISRLGRMEAAKFIKPGAAKGLLPAKNRVELLSGTGETVFVFEWGDSFDENEVSRTFVKTNKTQTPIEVNRALIEGLMLKNVFKEKTATAPNSKGSEGTSSEVGSDTKANAAPTDIPSPDVPPESR